MTVEEKPVEKKIVVMEDEETKNLYKQLLKKRLELAAVSDCMPYMVASNEALMNLSIAKPGDIETLKSLKCTFSCSYLFFVVSFKVFSGWFCRSKNNQIRNAVSGSNKTTHSYLK